MGLRGRSCVQHASSFKTDNAIFTVQLRFGGTELVCGSYRGPARKASCCPTGREAGVHIPSSSPPESQVERPHEDGGNPHVWLLYLRSDCADDRGAAENPADARSAG